MSRLAKAKNLLKMIVFYGVLILLSPDGVFVQSQFIASNARPPILTSVPETNFSCVGRVAGYYADVTTGCQSYHMCGMQSRKYSYLCPSYTLFHQKYMVCDHWRHVDCSVTEKYYDLNLKIGKVPNKESKKDSTSVKTSSTPQKETISKSSRRKSENTLTPIPKTDKTVLPPQNSNSFIPRTTFGFPSITRTTGRPKSEDRLSPTIPNTPNKPLKTRLLFEKPPKPASSPAPLNSFPLRPLSRRKGRGSTGKKFIFSETPKEFTESRDTERLKFHPIVIRPVRNLFEEESFTIRPEILEATPKPQLLSKLEAEINPNEAPVVDEFHDIPSFLIPPLPTIEEEVQISLPNISRFLLPPPPGAPIVIEGPNQEKKTPLVFTRRGVFNIDRGGRFFGKGSTSRQSNVGEILFSSPSLRGNPDFFIPSPGLLPPLVGNTLEQDSRGSNHHQHGHHNHHRMTMTFPKGKHSLGLVPLALNPNCPKCHPAFLRRNQCSPCVIIK